MQKRKVFTDYIHHDLDQSMHLLFEERLGWELFYADKSKDWEDLGLFVISPQKESLELIPNSPHREISFNEFKATSFDYLVTTYLNNEKPFKKLLKFTPGAVLIRQIGNSLERDKDIKNILLSTTISLNENTKSIRFIPEHRKEYKVLPPIFNRKIKSFFPHFPLYIEELTLWEKIQTLLPEFSFYMHGTGSTLKEVPHRNMPAAINDSMFIWHTNPNGCFGFIPRPALACGKPLITRLDHYQTFHTLGKVLLEDLVNCINIDPKVRSIEESANLIRYWSQPENYIKLSQQTLDKFNLDCNFDRQALEIKTWMESLKD